MTFSKGLSLVLFVIIGVVPLLPAAYAGEIRGFTASTLLGLAGFFAVPLVLAIHQWLYERGR